MKYSSCFCFPFFYIVMASFDHRRCSLPSTMLLLLSMALAVASGEITEDNGVLVLSEANFDEAVSAHNLVLVEFYAPWCGHCKAIAPKLEELALGFADRAEQVLIGKMDATENDVEHPRVNIEGFPTLKFFPKGDAANPVDYEGAREVAAMTTFLEGQLSATNAKNDEL